VQYIPLMWKDTFEDSEPVDMNDRICVIGFVLVVGPKSVLDALYNGAVSSNAPVGWNSSRTSSDLSTSTNLEMQSLMP
jgi:hypothetical protein